MSARRNAPSESSPTTSQRSNLNTSTSAVTVHRSSATVASVPFSRNSNSAKSASSAPLPANQPHQMLNCSVVLDRLPLQQPAVQPQGTSSSSGSRVIHPRVSELRTGTGRPAAPNVLPSPPQPYSSAARGSQRANVASSASGLPFAAPAVPHAADSLDGEVVDDEAERAQRRLSRLGAQAAPGTPQSGVSASSGQSDRCALIFTVFTLALVYFTPENN